MDDLNEIWTAYQQEASPEMRQRLVLQYAPLVKFFAGRVPGDPREVVQRGLEALTAAIDTYDPESGKFESHAIAAFGDAYSWDEGWE